MRQLQRLNVAPCKRNFSMAMSDKFRWNPEHLPIEEAFTPPQEWYTNGEIYQKEQDLVLKKYPQYIGHNQQLSQQNGAYFAGTSLNEPFITIRNGENQLSTYYNVCRHHASKLILDKHGEIDCAKGIKCPYHGWTYNINGQLIKATQLQGIKDFKNKNYGLLSIPNYKLFDDLLIFLDLSSSSSANHHTHKTFENMIKSVEEYSTNHGFDNDDLIHVYSRKYLLNCNWKIFVENYLDGGYHVPHLHVGLNNNLNADTYKTVIDGHVSFQTVHSAQNNKSDTQCNVDFAERIGDLGLYIYMYPNMMINRYGRWMDINYVYPKNVNECYVHFDYFLHRGTAPTDERNVQKNKEDGMEEDDLMNGCFYNLNKFSDEDVSFIKESLIASNQVQAEDILICEAVSDGLKSSAYRSHRGRYAPKLENALYQFHDLYNKDMF